MKGPTRKLKQGASKGIDEGNGVYGVEAWRARKAVKMGNKCCKGERSRRGKVKGRERETKKGEPITKL